MLVTQPLNCRLEYRLAPRGKSLVRAAASRRVRCSRCSRCSPAYRCTGPQSLLLRTVPAVAAAASCYLLFTDVPRIDISHRLFGEVDTVSLGIDTTANAAGVLSGGVYTLHLSLGLADASLFTQARCMLKIKHINLPRRRRSLWSSSADNVRREEAEKSTSRKMTRDAGGEQRERECEYERLK